MATPSSAHLHIKVHDFPACHGHLRISALNLVYDNATTNHISTYHSIRVPQIDPREVIDGLNGLGVRARITDDTFHLIADSTDRFDRFVLTVLFKSYCTNNANPPKGCMKLGMVILSSGPEATSVDLPGGLPMVQYVDYSNGDRFFQQSGPNESLNHRWVTRLGCRDCNELLPPWEPAEESVETERYGIRPTVAQPPQEVGGGCAISIDGGFTI